MSRTITQEVGHGRKFTEKQTALLDNFRTNGLDPMKAAIAAKYSKTSAYAAIRSVKDELIEIAETIMIQYGPKAAQTQVDILIAKKPVPQANVKLSASQSILDRIGLGKKDSLMVEHAVSGGLFILPAKQQVKVEKIINE